MHTMQTFSHLFPCLVPMENALSNDIIRKLTAFSLEKLPKGVCSFARRSSFAARHVEKGEAGLHGMAWSGDDDRTI